MRAIENAIFAIVVAVGLCGAILAYIADAVVPGYSIPSKSLLEGTELMTPDELFDKSYMKGEFQNSAETFIAGRVPCRNELLLLQAANQRMGIKTAAASFGYHVYPTFYGSDKVEVPNEGRLTSLSVNIPESTESQDVFNKLLNESKAKHPNARFVVNWILEDRQSSINPTYALMNQDMLLDEDWIRIHNVEPLDESIAVLIDTVYDSELAVPVFPSDVHWTLQRALESYNRIAGILDLEKVNWDELETRVAVDDWYGNEARSGLDLNYPNDTIDDVRDYSNLEFRQIGTGKLLTPASKGFREPVLDGTATEEQLEVLHYSGYSKYYGQGNADIVNSGPNNGKILLIIGDSYTYCLKRAFANNYERTIYMLPGNHPIEYSLDELIDEYDVDDVVFMMQCRKTNVIAKRSPAFIAGVDLDSIEETEDNE